MVDEKQTIDDLINKAIIVNKDMLNKDVIKKVINDIEINIIANQDQFLLTNKIDIKNNNGKLLNFKVIKSILQNIKKEEIYYGKVLKCQKDDTKIYGKEYLDRGNVLIFNDGNFYVILELFLKNFLVGNTSIFVTKGYMHGSNNLLITIVKEVLSQNKLSENFINIFVTLDMVEPLKEFANVNLNIVVGSKEEQRIVIDNSKVPVLTSGYLTYDLYIDDLVDKDFLTKIINLGLELNIYINGKLRIDLPGAIVVSDYKEAIATINYNGNGYSSTIITNNPNRASQFIKKVKSHIVTVNTSPSIESLMDIETSDLALLKTIIYPDIKEKERYCEVGKNFYD